MIHLKKIKSISQSNLFKITSLNSVSVLIKIAAGLVTSKILAVFVGPSGMALVGNFRNFTGSIESLSTLGFQNGIIKYLAENKEDNAKVSKIICTVLIATLAIIILISSYLLLYPDVLNHQIFGTNDFQFILKILAILLPFYGLYILFLSILNGLGRFKNVVFINIIGNIFGLILSIFLIIKFKTIGALLSIIVSPSLLFFVTVYYLNKDFSIIKNINFNNFDFKIIKNLSSYSLMTLASAIISPIIYIAIRNHIIADFGIEQAGFWETITRISSYYLLFITSILGIYYLPKLSIAKNNFETKTIFWSFYKSLIPIFIVGLICIYFLRFFIIKTLFTAEFQPVTSLFFWQLIGDLLKVCSWILAFNLLARKRTIVYLITEMFSFFLTYIFSIYFLQLFGIEGIVMAHALTYFVYLLVLVVYFRKSL
jgi:O-antigen/teichoic acid export membrane protein